MPHAAYQECRYPRCRNYAATRGYCITHAELAREQIRAHHHPSLAPNNRRFQWMRAAFLQRHPMCNLCHTAAASVLDHITPHRGIARLFWDQSNWQSLCATCHGRKTARESWGGDLEFTTGSGYGFLARGQRR